MTFPTRRKYIRHSDDIPILCAGYNDKSYSEAMMYNSCLDGMYFESESRLQPDINQGMSGSDRGLIRQKTITCHPEVRSMTEGTMKKVSLSNKLLIY